MNCFKYVFLRIITVCLAPACGVCVCMYISQNASNQLSVDQSECELVPNTRTRAFPISNSRRVSMDTTLAHTAWKSNIILLCVCVCVASVQAVERLHRHCTRKHNMELRPLHAAAPQRFTTAAIWVVRRCCRRAFAFASKSAQRIDNNNNTHAHYYARCVCYAASCVLCACFNIVCVRVFVYVCRVSLAQRLGMFGLCVCASVNLCTANYILRSTRCVCTQNIVVL